MSEGLFRKGKMCRKEINFFQELGEKESDNETITAKRRGNKRKEELKENMWRSKKKWERNKKVSVRRRVQKNELEWREGKEGMGKWEI